MSTVPTEVIAASEMLNAVQAQITALRTMSADYARDLLGGMTSAEARRKAGAR